jgi:hypothetical protein
MFWVYMVAGNVLEEIMYTMLLINYRCGCHSQKKKLYAWVRWKMVRPSINYNNQDHGTYSQARKESDIGFHLIYKWKLELLSMDTSSSSSNGGR